MQIMTPKTLPDLLLEQTPVMAEKPMLHYKKNGKFLSLSWSEVKDKTLQFSSVLQKLGVQPHDKVALMSNNRPEWVICDLGIMSMGGVVVPIYPTLGPKDVSYILNDCEATCIIVEKEEHLVMIESVMPTLNFLKTVIVLESTVTITSPDVYSYSQRMSQGSSANTDSLSVPCDENDLASIVYTSGTTGFPKGVMLSHRNFLSNVEGIISALPLTEKDKVLSFLPLSHVFERTAGYYTVLAVRGQIFYAESVSSVSDDLRLVKPTVVVSVPRLYEKIQAKVLDNLRGIKKPIFHWATGVSTALKQKPKSDWNMFQRAQFKLADRLVFRKIRQRTGGKLRFFVSGGAPLNPEIAKFFDAIGLLIIEGYGQTETSPVISCNRIEKHKFGSVGKPLKAVEVKLAAQNELCVKGPNVMLGYLNLDEKTQTIIDSDGWLHTGDVATIDEDGYIFITDRLKDIIVLSNGKNVAPLPIEQAVSLSPFISQAVVIGEKRNFVSALIVPEFEQLKRFAKANGLQTLSLHELLSHAKVNTLFEKEIAKYTSAFSHYEKIKKFELMAVPFTLEAGELTPTLKPKRKVIHEVYADIISRLYEG